MSQKTKSIVLASSSVYRANQLKQLGFEFQTESPDIDESPLENESAINLVLRLAKTKAEEISLNHPDSLIIGADQLLTGPIHHTIDDDTLFPKKIFGKPGNFKTAKNQLMALNGHRAELITGLALLNTTTGECQTTHHITQIRYRNLTEQQIERYLQKEQPFDCAGSAKIEGLGIGLVLEIKGDDPSAIIGLPLISLITMLNNEDIELF